MARQAGFKVVILPLLGSVVFAAGLAAYIYHSIPSREELLAGTPDPSTSTAFSYAESLDARVKKAATDFIEAIREKRYADAYASMAPPYRKMVSASRFETTCKTSPFLSTAKTLTIYTVNETIPPGGGIGAISGSGVLSSDAGTVSTKLTFLAEGDRLTILSVIVADAPVLAPVP